MSASAAVLDLAAEEEDDDEDCPDVSPHPAVPRPGRTELWWIEESLGRGRVVAHTCACQMTSYELVRCGGVYQFCRRAAPTAIWARRDVPPVSWTARWWRREEAYAWWRRLLAGQAR
ncbi:hypothetical protein AB0O28_37205 [Microbispora sp. NPDC088329]|uniref:hypothetical protein n=1 Tax=Microbispora sp. NPDC088329 TaxID=3154869 RepID=UPI00342D6ACE